MAKRIFVFGSNLAGVHGAGAAKTALREHGALWGLGFGPSGHSFAIPTKDMNIQTMQLEVIKGYVQGFLSYADFWRDKEFQVTRIGCGLAGLSDVDMGPMFAEATPNCFFDSKWEGLVDIISEKKYWGTF